MNAKKAALDILRKIREHVGKNGVTGGNSAYDPSHPVCPRGLIHHFAQEQYGDTRVECTNPPEEESAAWYASEALDIAAGAESYNEGKAAEMKMRELERRNGVGRAEEVALIDAAIRHIEFAPKSELDQLKEMFQERQLRDNISAMPHPDTVNALRKVRTLVGKL